MKIQENKRGNIVVLELDGRLDASTSGMLEERLFDLMDQGEKNFILDFNQLEYVSSSGLRVLLMAAKRTGSTGGKVVLSSLKEAVKEVLEIAGFCAIFPICTTVEEGEALF